jgi:hypothetical protein
MKPDRLLALIRLANNNPSENEANRAARKVCQVLGEHKRFMIDGNYTAQPFRTAADKVRQHASNYGGSDFTDEIFQNMYDTIFGGRRAGKSTQQKEQAKTWNDVRRNDGEPEFRSKPSNPPNQEYWKGGFRPSAAQEEFFKNAQRVNVKDEPWVKWDEGRNWSTSNPNIRYDANGKRIRDHAVRKCSKCGWEVDTFRIKEEPFVCNPCHWKEYP